MEQNKTTTRQLDQLGRIVLPAEFRRDLDISLGDMLDISLHGTHIEIQKSCPICRLCGKRENLSQFGSAWVCHDCIDALQR